MRKVPIHERLFSAAAKKCEIPSPKKCDNKPDCILENYNSPNKMLVFKKIEVAPSESKLSFSKLLRVPKMTDWKCSSKGTSSASKSVASKSDFSPKNTSIMRTPKMSKYN